MNRKITLFFLVFYLLCSNLIVAQDLKVTGKVTDENGASLPGVSVKVKGTTNGTQTNLNGDFNVSAPRWNGRICTIWQYHLQIYRSRNI